MKTRPLIALDADGVLLDYSLAYAHAYFGECDRSFRRIVTGGLRGVFSAVSVT